MPAALRSARTLRWSVFLLLAVAGLFYVKWFPYYGRAFDAAAQHSIGKSILMGDASSAPDPSLAAALGYALAYGKAIWKAMVLGLLLGSGVQALIPASWVRRAMGSASFAGTVAGGLMGIPGMMCTCCAAPVVVGLRRQQAAAGPSVAFWLANTMLNPATLVFTGFVLGWNWTLLRVVLSVPMVFGLGYLANRFAPAQGPLPVGRRRAEPEPDIEDPSLADVGRRWLTVFLRMTLRLIPEYIVIVLLLGAARAWMFPHIGPDIGEQWFWIVALAVAGMLFVIPTAGEVPIVQAMLALGMGVGPAAALLLTLPPVSLPSMAMLGRSLPWRLLLTLAAAVVVFGILAGAIASGLDMR
ncbi:MAG TPA: permease [Luteibacter sp.]|uniref:permease n=1 Tax=Luteibacter sp. TaxID=1886636 RepID=UPI002BA404A4|nr:permease [Luteibacter sp.]HVI55955.1 permease [Luteibacter sp.]